MANYYLANPTSADITAGSLTIKAGKVLLDTTDAVAADLQTALDAGCTIASATKSTTLDANTQLVEKGSRLLLGMVRAVASAGSDSHGQAGL